jgi:hypothetical protein
MLSGCWSYGTLEQRFAVIVLNGIYAHVLKLRVLYLFSLAS